MNAMDMDDGGVKAAMAPSTEILIQAAGLVTGRRYENHKLNVKPSKFRVVSVVPDPDATGEVISYDTLNIKDSDAIPMSALDKVDFTDTCLVMSFSKDEDLAPLAEYLTLHRPADSDAIRIVLMLPPPEPHTPAWESLTRLFNFALMPDDGHHLWT